MIFFNPAVELFSTVRITNTQFRVLVTRVQKSFTFDILADSGVLKRSTYKVVNCHFNSSFCIIHSKLILFFLKNGKATYKRHKTRMDEKQ